MLRIPVPVRNLEFTEADSMLRDSGYPHDEGSLPHSQEVISHLVGRLRRIGGDWDDTRLRGRETIESMSLGKSHGE